MKLTSKDLINTYIENDNGKLLKLYMETCASVGLHVFHDGDEAFDAEFYRDGLFIACTEHSVPSSEGVLQLLMTEDDLGYELTWEELAKMNIDNLATQTPEEKEALDLIDTTPHQYEMSKFKSNPVIQLSIDEIDKFSGNEWNGEGLPPVGVECEWSNGDECLYMNSSEVHKFIGIDPTRSDFCYIKANCSAVNWVEIAKLSKPESKEAKEKRERLEAAYDLYCEECRVMECSQFTFNEFKDEQHLKARLLAIVDKTNYRKESN